MSGQIAGEGWFLLHSFLFGIFLTYVYDLFRIFRRVIPHGIFWISVEDLIFWILTAAGIFGLLYYENNGAFRWFAVFGTGAGMFLYKKMLSEPIVRLVSGGIRFLFGWIGKLMWKLSAPLRFLGRKVRILFGRGLRRCQRELRILKRTINCRLTAWIKAFRIKLSKHRENGPTAKSRSHRRVNDKRK